MHRVAGDKEKIGAASFEAPGGIDDNFGRALPVAGMLKFFDRFEINAIHQYLGRMQTAKALFYPFIYESIVKQTAFPAHTPD